MKKQWISVKCGLSRDPKHRQRMGEGVWLYLHILDIASWEDGIAHEWKDEAEAEEMGMPVRTLREHRRKLAEDGYITCIQKQYTQDIVIHNWTNPREYSGQVYNKTQGDTEMEAQKTPQDDTQGYIQGNRKHVTPTSNSKNQITNKEGAEKSAKPPTPPEVKLFREVTERYPNKVNFEDVTLIIQGVSKRLQRDATVEDLRPFYAAWCANGWNKLNLAWLAYAERGEIPTVQKFKPQNKAQASADALENYVKKLELEASQ